MQPSLSLNYANLKIGAWGSYCFTSNEAAESDIFLSYTLFDKIKIGVTDYYFPGNDYFDYSDTSGSHAFELNFGLVLNSFSLNGNYIINKAPSAGSAGNDIYVEINYSFRNANLFVGAGNGWHTADQKFNVCQIGLNMSRQIEVSDKFSFPLTGALIFNPDKKQLFVVAIISL